MRNLIITMSSILLSVSAYAGSTICAGPELYYSSIRKDFGTPPMPGIQTGSTVIVHEGKVLLNEEHFFDLGAPRQRTYEVRLEGAKKDVKSYGNRKAGSSIFIQDAVIYKISDADLTQLLEVGRESVLCRESWMLAQ